MVEATVKVTFDYRSITRGGRGSMEIDGGLSSSHFVEKRGEGSKKEIKGSLWQFAEIQSDDYTQLKGLYYKLRFIQELDDGKYLRNIIEVDNQDGPMIDTLIKHLFPNGGVIEISPQNWNEGNTDKLGVVAEVTKRRSVKWVEILFDGNAIFNF